MAAKGPLARTTPEETPARRGLRTLASVATAAAVFGFWAWYVLTLRGTDGDYYWHLLAGRLMLAGHPPFTRDVFSWTAAGRPWFDHEWLGEIGLALLARAGGVKAVKIAYAGAMIAWFAAVFGMFRKAGLSARMSAWGALATCLSAYTVLWPRMQGFSLLGMTATLALLQRWWQSGRLPRWSLLAYPIAVALWANLHGGGAIAGPASCLVVLGIEAIVPKRLRTPGTRQLALVTALAGVALLCNPRTWRLIAFSLSPWLDPAIRAMNAMIPEWRAFSWDDPLCRHDTFWAATIVGSALVATLARGRPDARGSGQPPQRAIKLSMLGLAVVWGALGLASRRQLPLFAIATVPLAAAILATAVGAAATLAPAPRSWLRLLVIAGVVVTVGPGVGDRVLFGPLTTGLLFPSRSALRQAVQMAPGRHLLNLYDWGGDLELAGYPAVKDFIDGRQYLFGLPLNEAHDRMMGARPGWRRDLARYRIDMVFAPPGVPLVARLARNPAWRLAFADSSAVIMLRQRVLPPARRQAAPSEGSVAQR